MAQAQVATKAVVLLLVEVELDRKWSGHVSVQDVFEEGSRLAVEQIEMTVRAGNQQVGHGGNKVTVRKVERVDAVTATWVPDRV